MGRVKLYVQRRFMLLTNIWRTWRRGQKSLWWCFRHLHLYASDSIIDIRTQQFGDVHIYMYGSDHRLLIEDHVTFKKGVICFEDTGCQISIRSGTTIEDASLSAVEDKCRIQIGKNCLISSNIYMSTSDAHSILANESGLRINRPGSIDIADHVWIGYNATINKGVTINRDSVVAGNSVVTKDIPNNVIVAGVPAKIVKSSINWDRKRQSVYQ